MIAAIPAPLMAELTQPSPSYKRHVWMAVAGLVLFIVLYVALAGWFLFTAYRVTLGATTATFGGWVVGGCALLLAVFMLKPWFLVKRGGAGDVIEIRPEEQPRLFAFLHELADSAAAPRPHKVFLSPRVNASVFYHLSALNLLFPLKKNLEIGLGLVNALTLGEFRAVLAHEFGHFTQRSMAIGRWVYLAHQVSAYLVAQRDKLDDFLQGLSRFDIRVAWIGWLLSLVVWSIRSLVHSAFSGLLLLQRALGREMEMQADLVAVSLTGSDALVHALHRLQAADDAWDRTMSLVGGPLSQGRIPADVFTLHASIMERLGDILSDPRYGRVAPVPAEHPDQHRVFSPELAQPPLMWLTHPPNHEREANAKRYYVGAPIDARSAWTLFENPAEVRRAVSAKLLGTPAKAVMPTEESLDELQRQLGREYLDRRYRGLYLGRSIVRGAQRVDELLEPASQGWREQLDQLYRETLAEDVARLRSLDTEAHLLRALQAGALTPPDGVIRHRGRTLRVSEIPHVIRLVEGEARTIEERLRAHDRRCRTVHLAAAQAVGGGWDAYLRGLHQALHYADHTVANLDDLHGLLSHTVRVVTVTRRVSSSGRQRVVDAATALHRALGDVARNSVRMTLDPVLAGHLGDESWAESVGKYGLAPPDDKNIGEWLKVIDGWVNQIANPCRALRTTALEELLRTEAALAEHVRRGTVADPAPPPSAFPPPYDTLLGGAERKRKAELSWWERFQIADGLLPGTARFAVAATIVVLVLGFSDRVGNTTITAYNGLALPVVMSVGDRQWRVNPFTSQTVEVDAEAALSLEARTVRGEVIESFSPKREASFGHFVYNIGGVSPLVEWTAVYGNVQPRQDRVLGAPRWISTRAVILLTDPPESVSTSGGGDTRLVMTGLAAADPARQLRLLESPADRDRVVRAHVRWDPTRSSNVLLWWRLAELLVADHRQLLEQRLAEAPNDVVLLRIEQDAAADSERVSVCARHQAMVDAAPDNADLRYVATRCMPDADARRKAFAAGYRRWPAHPWFVNAVGYDHAEAGRWPQAIAAMEQARRALPPLNDLLAVDLVRLHRLMEDQAEAAIARLVGESSRVSDLMTLETGEGYAGPLLAYAELAQGHLDSAVVLAADDPEGGARVVRLAASSDGASPDLIARALALSPDVGLDEDTRWSSVGLAVRLGRDVHALLDSTAVPNPDHLKRIRRFIEQVRAGTDRSATEQTLDGLPIVLRGQAYSVGTIVLGRRAPPSWRRMAKALLFVSERPYFK